MPNIAIYEGGKAARMNGVSRITTDDGNDGKIVWVPQSDRQTGTLYVSENGTYRAEDEGLHSWSKVTVRLAGAPLGLEVPTLPDPITGAEIPTGEEGELEPVPPAGLEPIDEDTEIVNADDIDQEDPDAIEELADELGVSPEDIIVVDPEDPSTVKEAEPKVEDKGQKAVGTDPDTGDPATITPSGKEGAIVPDELRILVEPTKTSYEDGETIDYSGIQCALYKNGQFIRNATFDELSFPVDTATYDGTKVEYSNDDNTVNVVLLLGVQNPYMQKRSPTSAPRQINDAYLTQPIGVVPSGDFAGQPMGIYSGTPFSIYMTKYDGRNYVKLVSGYCTHSLGTIQKQGENYPMYWGASTVANGTYRPNSIRYTADTWGDKITDIPVSTIHPDLAGSSPMHAAGQRQSVPVNWSGDGTSLGASFSIMVYWDDVD